MDKRGLTPLEVNRRKIARLNATMRYKKDDDYTSWRKAAKEKLAELLLCPTERVEPLLDVEYDVIKSDRREIRFSFQSEPDYFVPCCLIIPLEAKTPCATVICLQGHSTGMHFSIGEPLKDGDAQSIIEKDRDFAVQAVKHGYCALALEQRCFGTCGGKPEPDCNDSSLAALLAGRTTVGERVWDVSRAIDVLTEYFSDFVDVGKIYCTGNSGGGTTTFYAACMDERIAAAMPSCAVCTYARSIGAVHHCPCNYIPHIARHFDMGDLCGLIAPRGLVIVSGAQDGIFPIDGAEECANMAKAFYSMLGVPEKFEWVIGDGGHRFYANICWDALKRVTAN